MKYLLLLLTPLLYAQEAPKALVHTTINIAVAANVSYAIDALKDKFAQNHPEIQVNVTLGSSGKLAAQISHGAPYGLFMSANMAYVEKLYLQHNAITKPRVYARGTLSLFSTKKQDFTTGIELLNTKSIQKIAIANPKTAPYGKAAKEAMQTANIFNAIKHKLIFAESIAQTLSFTMAAADIGLVASSSLYSAKMSAYKKYINYVKVDTKLYTPIKQGVSLLSFSKNAQKYRLFYEFLFSVEAKKIFKQYGYIIL